VHDIVSYDVKRLWDLLHSRRRNVDIVILIKYYNTEEAANFMVNETENGFDKINDITSLSLSIKRYSHELGKLVDVLYGALMSYLLWVISKTIMEIKSTKFILNGELIVSVFCLFFVLLFIIEDYRGMRLITSICGYYQSSFRYYFDVLIAMNLFIAILYLNPENRDAPSRYFVLAMASVYFLCSLWALLLSKNKNEMPGHYVWLVFSSHLLIFFVWLLLYSIIIMPTFHINIVNMDFKIELISKNFIVLLASIYVIYCLLINFSLRNLRRKGYPVDEFVEILLYKLYKGVFAFIGAVFHLIQIGIIERRLEWIFSTYYRPKAKYEPYKVRKVFQNGTEDKILLSEFINENAAHMSYSAKIICVNEPDQGVRILVLNPLALRPNLKYYLIQERGHVNRCVKRVHAA